MKSLLSVAVLTIALSGCVTQNAYIEPTQTTGQPAPATVTGYDQGDSAFNLCTFRSAKVMQVDDKDVSPSSMSLGNPYPEQVKIIPGKHTLVIANRFKDGCFSEMRAATPEITATFASGQNYFIKGNVQQNHVSNWLEDQNGKKVSDVVIAPYAVRAVA